MDIPVALPFPREEFQRRLAALRERMTSRGLDVLLVYTPENMYYLTGYQTTGYYAYQCLVVPVEQEPVMVLRLLEVPNLLTGSILKRYEPIEDTQDPVQVTCDVLKKHGLAEARIGMEEGSFFLSVADHARTVSMLSGARWSDGGNLVEHGRVVKSPLEIQCMREAAGIVAKGMLAGFEASEPGRTEDDVAAEVCRALIANGSSYFCTQPYVTSGPRTGITHATWSGRRIQRNELVYFEISANVKRYSAALKRPIFMGKPSDQAKRMSDGAIAGLNAAIEFMRPGVTSGEVDRVTREAVAKAGCAQYFTHRTAYSIGLGFPPGWGEGHIMDLKPGDPRILREGMSFHPIGAFHDHGVMGMGFSETVLITKDGCEPLTSGVRRELYMK